MFDRTTYHHTTVPPDTLSRIENQMVEAARKEATSIVEQRIAADKRATAPAPHPTPDAIYHNSGAIAGESMKVALGNQKYISPRLEPYHCEVKSEMRERKLTEREAEKKVRIRLLKSATYGIADRATAEMLLAVLSVI